MKPQFEQVTVAPGQSWTLLWRELPELPFLWHYHPEFELTLTLNARGQRHVGDSLEDFESGDLVLLGPNQPHTWAASERADDETRPMLAVVVWFSEAWLARLIEGWPELAVLQRLAEGAGRGLHFSPAASQAARPLLMQLQDLTPEQRLPLLLQVLPLLARDEAARPLATHAANSPNGDKLRGRLQRVLARLHAAPLDEPPDATALAAEAALSLGAFHRFFKRHTGMTMGDYQAQLRIGAACQLLISTEKPIGVIALEAGYGTAAHFNRQFLARKNMTPRAFRMSYR